MIFIVLEVEAENEWTQEPPAEEGWWAWKISPESKPTVVYIAFNLDDKAVTEVNGVPVVFDLTTYGFWKKVDV